jgi:hypothetical protein
MFPKIGSNPSENTAVITKAKGLSGILIDEASSSLGIIMRASCQIL